MRWSLLQWLPILMYAVIVAKIESIYVNITYVQSAVAKGAVCLDGSPPAYHFDRGYGTGNKSWLIQLEGGGWCNNVTTCLARKGNRLGSSRQMVKELAFSGLLGNKAGFNPDFYNWNRVKVRYCDGSSFTGDVEAVNPVTRLYYRGARVFLAVMEDLLAKGMKNAEKAMLSGCSAGGLASILHCDNFKNLLPVGTKVKCLSDAGFFINAKDVSGGQHVEAYYNEIVTTHGSAKNLPQSCTLRMKPSLVREVSKIKKIEKWCFLSPLYSCRKKKMQCFFPQYSARGIRTPLFLVNAAYDSWQIKNILAPGDADPHGRWHDCKTNILKCTPIQLKIMQGFRLEFNRVISGLGLSVSRGLFINSCYAHCQTEMQETWFRTDSPKLNNKTIAKAVGDWFYDRSPFQRGDCPYPCDKTCHNRVFDPSELPLM